MQPAFHIAPVRTPKDLAAAVKLFRDYAGSLPIDLGYQDFEAEMAAMPGKYAPPAGELLLARDAMGVALGCVALRPIEDACEMKRLYVVPAARGAGLGEKLVAAILREAERIGYRTMKLDTLASMTGAQTLYRKFGFATIAAYYETPVADTVFMGKSLAPGVTS